MVETTLITMRGFQLYTPEYSVHPDGTPHLCDDQGNDWYYWQYKFQEDTLKIVFDENDNGVITSACYDVQFILPFGGTGYAITEVPANEVPGGFDVDEFTVGDWIFIDGKIQQTGNGRALQLKRVRTGILTATDFMVVADYPLSDDERKLLSVTRQALRDLPALQDFPQVTLPDCPTFMLDAAYKAGVSQAEYNYLRTVK